MHLITGFTSLPTTLLLAIFTHPAIAQAQQPTTQQPLYAIASFDSSSNFALDTACDNIYRRGILSCQPFDFSDINPCSTLCIEALQSAQQEAQQACATQGGIPTNSLLTFFRNGTGVDKLCGPGAKSGASTTLVPQVSVGTGSGASPTVPVGAGGVSTATEVAADVSKATSMDLGNGGVVAIIVIVIVGSVLLLLASVFYYKKYYSKG